METNVSSSSPATVEQRWRETDPDKARTGTVCKCGTHCSLQWAAGGKDWLDLHVKAVHQTDRNWLAEIRYALTMTPEECKKYLEKEITGLD